MTIETALTLLAILTPLNIFLWHHLGTYRLHSKPKTELGIDYNTLRRWEDNGLPRYIPPLEDTRKVFYRVTDILQFLGVK